MRENTKGAVFDMGSEVQITWEALVAFAAAVVTISKCVDVLLRFTRPQKEIKKRADSVYI